MTAVDQHAARRNNVCALRRAQSCNMSFPQLLEVRRGRIGTSFKFPNLICGRDEGLDQFDDSGAGPGHLPVFDTVESRHSAWVAVHHPQKDRLIFP